MIADTITANKNTVPFDPESPFVTSGMRLGTAAITTRGFNEEACYEVAEIISNRLLNPENISIKQKCIEQVSRLCKRFPLYDDTLNESQGVSFKGMLLIGTKDFPLQVNLLQFEGKKIITGQDFINSNLFKDSKVIQFD